MKPTTSNIKALLDNKTYRQNLAKLKASSSTYVNQETTVQEACEKMEEILSALENGIKKGILDELPFGIRNNIHAQLNNALRYSNNANQFIPHFNILYQQFTQSNLLLRLAEDQDIIELSNQLNSFRTKFLKAKKTIDDNENIKQAYQKLKADAIEKNSIIDDSFKAVNETNKLLESTIETIGKRKKTIDGASQEIENRKKEILAFASRVSKTEESINRIETNVSEKASKSIDDQIIKAKELITLAEKALLLRETEGISAAMSARLTKLTESKAKNWWLGGAIVFVFVTIFLGFLLTGGNLKIGSFILGFEDTDKISFFLGRIVVALIGVSAAIFCSKQYLNLNKLEEDYEYKVVLSKSLLAFSNKIKDIDKEKVADYLTTVLTEIHKDPQRSRKVDKARKLDLDSVKEIIDLVKSIPNS